jgi:ferredoxin-nitrite reductase
LGIFVLQSTTAICPSLFNATSAQDGILSRMRLPAGLITSTQCEVVAKITNQFGNDEIQITNRANLQIRTSQALSSDTLLDLQDYRLASSLATTDGLRNIMASPTAGIDPHALINTIPFMKQWNFYLANHPELEILSNKFSVCFDGDELVNVCDRPNDICLVAVKFDHEIYFDLHLGLGDRGDAPSAVGRLIHPKRVLEVLAALTEVYREYTGYKLNQSNSGDRLPRLRELINDWGVDRYLQIVEQKFGDVLQRREEIPPSPPCEGGRISHIGVHAQKQLGLFYIGVVIPLGRLTATQFQDLANLARAYGGGALRLTPWQNMLITDIAEAQVAQVTREINGLGLSISANNPYAAIAACSGYTGCKSAHTNTQADAKKVAAHLESCIQLDHPINIHFSGCDKSCAQHHPSDICLVGIASGTDTETYKIYVGDGDTSFGRELYLGYGAENIPTLIEKLLKIYQDQRQNSTQTFREFVNQQS